MQENIKEDFQILKRSSIKKIDIVKCGDFTFYSFKISPILYNKKEHCIHKIY